MLWSFVLRNNSPAVQFITVKTERYNLQNIKLSAIYKGSDWKKNKLSNHTVIGLDALISASYAVAAMFYMD